VRDMVRTMMMMRSRHLEDAVLKWRKVEAKLYSFLEMRRSVALSFWFEVILGQVRLRIIDRREGSDLRSRTEMNQKLK